MNRFFKWIDEKIGFPVRHKALVRNLHPLLVDHCEILDLGASCGRLGKALQDKLPGSRFRGVDTHVQPKSYIPVDSYDGVSLPFEDNSFDCVIIVDVLHHAENPRQLIEEAARVSRKSVLVKDHYWRFFWNRWFLKLYDKIGNDPYGIPEAWGYYRQREWKELFEGLNLPVKKWRAFRYHLGDPCPHVYYLLKTSA